MFDSSTHYLVGSYLVDLPYLLDDCRPRNFAGTHTQSTDASKSRIGFAVYGDRIFSGPCYLCGGRVACLWVIVSSGQSCCYCFELCKICVFDARVWIGCVQFCNAKWSESWGDVMPVMGNEVLFDCFMYRKWLFLVKFFSISSDKWLVVRCDHFLVARNYLAKVYFSWELQYSFLI